MVCILCGAEWPVVSGMLLNHAISSSNCIAAVLWLQCSAQSAGYTACALAVKMRTALVITSDGGGRRIPNQSLNTPTPDGWVTDWPYWLHKQHMCLVECHLFEQVRAATRAVLCKNRPENYQ